MSMSLGMPLVAAPLEPDLVPAAAWTRDYRRLVAADPARRTVTLTLSRGERAFWSCELELLADSHPAAPATLRFVERTMKFLLWQKGASRVFVTGAPDVAAHLSQLYRPGGTREFDARFMGGTVYRSPFAVEATAAAPPVAPDRVDTSVLGRHLDGCRVGFDLGGSDRKVAALIDGRVVFSEEVPWNPYFQQDPEYHVRGVADSIARAAKHLPRVDAIGGSAAGVYVDNEVRVASLFRGVPPADFERRIRPMFSVLQREWNGVPFVVVNDGEVTALAGSMALDSPSVLGISMGTSQAAGYVTPEGGLTSWLNELAFAPVDFNPHAAADEWSGDVGCGVQYFSQQGVVRLARRAGLDFSAGASMAENLLAVQDALAAGSDRARQVYETVGTVFGYALAYYAEFYDIRHVLLLGRVASGDGGDILIQNAEMVMRTEFPSLAERLRIKLPDERTRRHGQAIAAASLAPLETALR